jgi:Polysaccharide lyase
VRYVLRRTTTPFNVRFAQSTSGPLWAAAAFLVMALLAHTAAGTAEARVMQRLDYDSGNFRQWAEIQAVPGGAKIIRKPRRQGRFAARFRVEPGDDPIGATGERAELRALTGEAAGKVSWWKWSTRFPRGFTPARNDWNVFTQWHHLGRCGQPPVSFVVDGYRKPFRLRLKVNSGRLAGCDGGTTRRTYSLGRLRRAKWLTFVLHVRWSPTRRGFVEVWRNGRKVLGKKRIPTLYRGYGVYVKQGFYRSSAGWTATVIHDGLRRFNRRPYSLR